MSISTQMVAHIRTAHVIILALELIVLAGVIMVELQDTLRSQSCRRPSFHHGGVR